MSPHSPKTEFKTLVLLIGLNNVPGISICEELLDEEECLLLLTLLEVSRYMTPRLPVPKSIHWLNSVLPQLDDKRFRAQIRIISLKVRNQNKLHF